MQVNTSSTLTVLHDGQFWVGICEHAESGRYGACRIVFGAVEPADTYILALVCHMWEKLPFNYELDASSDALREAADALEHTNPKRRARKAHKWVAKASTAGGVGTKAQQAISAGYEARKVARSQNTRQARAQDVQRKRALKQQKRKQKHKGH